MLRMYLLVGLGYRWTFCIWASERIMEKSSNGKKSSGSDAGLVQGMEC